MRRDQLLMALGMQCLASGSGLLYGGLNTALVTTVPVYGLAFAAGEIREVGRGDTWLVLMTRPQDETQFVQATQIPWSIEAGAADA